MMHHRSSELSKDIAKWTCYSTPRSEDQWSLSLHNPWGISVADSLISTVFAIDACIFSSPTWTYLISM